MTVFSNNRPGHSKSLLLVVIFLLALLTVYWSTAWSVVSIWLRSETFAHGFLIIPIVIWMVWTRRSQLRATPATRSYFALIPLLMAGVLWLLADIVDVLVVQQFALVSMIIAGIWVLLGTGVCRVIAFPLAYLFFLVPVGEALIPAMMVFTAEFTVAMIKLTGIPVYQEGLFFYLPTSTWSVVEACSGVRYLIASITLGCLYAYLTYQSVRKRVIFIILSAVVPIFANGLRAYIIVMLGHLSDLKIATGVDHLIYGWIFFGLVMFILFAIGNIWRDKDYVRSQNAAYSLNKPTPALQVQDPVNVTLFIMALLAICVWPVFAYNIEHRSLTQLQPVSIPVSFDGWHQTDEVFSWRPETSENIEESIIGFKDDQNRLKLVIQRFVRQSQGKELVAGERVIFPDDNKSWRFLSRATINLDDVDFNVREAVVMGPGGQRLLIWQWYRVGNRYNGNNIQTKLLEVLMKLSFGRQDVTRLFVAIPVDELQSDSDIARESLKDFLTIATPIISISLDRAAGASDDEK